MWVFSGESLNRRLELNETLGWWLDYWLFLHCDDTHPVWCARPLGLKTLASEALVSIAPTDWTLRKRLKHEIANAAKMSPFLLEIPAPPSVPLVIDGSNWSGPWLEWITTVDACAPTAIAESLIGALCVALAEERTKEVAYLSRRLAAELGSEGWSERQLWTTAKNVFLDSGKWAHRTIDRNATAEALKSAFAASSRRQYVVTFAVLPVRVTKAIINTVGRGRRLIVENDGDQLRLTGIRNTAYATHPEQAVVKSHRVAVGILETLRLSFYVRSNLYGAAKVVDYSTSAELWVSLAQPFWSNRPSTRKAPRFPLGGYPETMCQMSANDAERWSAARWHLSQAFASWSEDIHSSAATVWQALEAFAPGNQNPPLARVQGAGQTYLSRVCKDMISHLNMKFRCHRHALIGIGERNLGHPTLQKSELRLLSDRDTGLLVVLSRRLKRPDSEAWMDTRIEDDLSLLYALRNKVVHSGARTLPDRMAAYLASLGAEIIFALMSAPVCDKKKAL